jgi:hypothetical protein
MIQNKLEFVSAEEYKEYEERQKLLRKIVKPKKEVGAPIIKDVPSLEVESFEVPPIEIDYLEKDVLDVGSLDVDESKLFYRRIR